MIPTIRSRDEGNFIDLSVNAEKFNEYASDRLGLKF
jgi:hypothetical protein